MLPSSRDAVGGLTDETRPQVMKKKKAKKKDGNVISDLLFICASI